MPALPQLIPLFPLPDAVLFPGMPMVLHVFEPRYRKLVADVIDGGQGLIGISLLQPGWEADYYGRPGIFPIGCAGRLERHEALPDGRYNIVLEGVTRYRVLEEHAGEPYRLASVEALDDVGPDRAAFERVRTRLLGALAQAAQVSAVAVLRSEVSEELFVNALCQSLPLAPVERQSLLDCATLEGRAERLVEILDFRHLEDTFGRRTDRSTH